MTNRPARVGTATETRGLVCVSRAMREVVSLVDRAALNSSKVLVTGESGVGKDMVATEIHRRSARAHARFVPVNCAGLAETLLESELFGHVRGSFTGASRDRMGKLQLAHGGTLFLDEVGDMSLRMQGLLLRFLENGEIQPVGSDRIGAVVDVRVIAATNRDLAQRVAAGEFREDLLYRLRVIDIPVPPLRQRPEDIPVLLEQIAASLGRNVTFTREALAFLKRHRWPGNIRELQNVLEQTLILVEGDEVGPEHLPAYLRESTRTLLPVRERRRQVADMLYDALVGGGYEFWTDVYPLFMQRDLTRHDVRELVRRGLRETRGSYRGLVRLFGMPDGDYKRFLNFLASHSCQVDVQPFRAGVEPVRELRRPLELPMRESTESEARAEEREVPERTTR